LELADPKFLPFLPLKHTNEGICQGKAGYFVLNQPKTRDKVVIARLSFTPMPHFVAFASPDKAPPVHVEAGQLAISAPSKELAKQWAQRIATSLAPGVEMRVTGKQILLPVAQVTETQIALKVSLATPLAGTILRRAVIGLHRGTFGSFDRRTCCCFIPHGDHRPQSPMRRARRGHRSQSRTTGTSCPRRTRRSWVRSGAST
jgi:hypothetical protein